jgi:hypothetical protein
MARQPAVRIGKGHSSQRFADCGGQAPQRPSPAPRDTPRDVARSSPVRGLRCVHVDYRSPSSVAPFASSSSCTTASPRSPGSVGMDARARRRLHAKTPLRTGPGTARWAKWTRNLRPPAGKHRRESRKEQAHLRVCDCGRGHADVGERRGRQRELGDGAVGTAHDPRTCGQSRLQHARRTLP